MQGKTEQEAKQAAIEAEAKNVYGFNAVKGRDGRYTEQGIGSVANPSVNHFAALRKAEQMGLEPPGAHAKAIAEIWKSNPEWAKQNLPPPVRA